MSMLNPSLYSPSELQTMREWIADCVWHDLSDPSELSDAQVVRGVSRHYDGGIGAFLRDSLPISAVAY